MGGISRYGPFVCLLSLNSTISNIFTTATHEVNSSTHDRAINIVPGLSLMSATPLFMINVAPLR